MQVIPDYILEPPAPTARQEYANALISEYESGRKELERRRVLLEEQEELVRSLRMELEEMGYIA